MKLRIGLFWILIVFLFHIVIKNILELMDIKIKSLNIKTERMTNDLKFNHGSSNSTNENDIDDNEKDELLKSLNNYIDNSTSYNQNSMSNMNNTINNSISLHSDIVSKQFSPETMNKNFMAMDDDISNFYEQPMYV